jgi:hypothetical protein
MDIISIAMTKNTAQLIEEIKDSTITTKYYSVNVGELITNGLGYSVIDSQSPSSSIFTLTIGALFSVVIFEDGVLHKLVDAPFDFIYANGAIWNNAHQFKRVGITSPVIAQQLGVNDILWFDTTIPKLMEHFGMTKGSYELVFGDASESEKIEGVVTVLFTIDTSFSQAAYQVKGLWEFIFANPETRFIFEYENQENIPVIDAPYIYDATPVDVGGLGNGD